MRFAELITGLAQTFQTPISASDLENYWRWLRPYALSSIEQAVVDFCRSPDAHKFFPKPGELVAALEGGSAGQALRAWSKVMHAIRRVGAYRTVVFDDPLIHAVIWDMGGWQTLCAMLTRDEPFRAREFEKRYTSYLARPPTAYPRQLSGITETVNASKGYHSTSPPILVGDQQKALQVLKTGQEAGQLLSLKPVSPEQYARCLLTKKKEEFHMISVIIIDQDLMFCQLLEKIVSNREITVTGQATTGAKGIDLIRKHKQKSPLVIMINTQLSDMSGEAVCRFINRHWPHILCIYLLNVIHWPTLNRLMNSSAKGVVTKEACYLSLEAIRMVGNGKTYLQPDLAFGLLDYRAHRAGCNRLLQNYPRVNMKF